MSAKPSHIDALKLAAQLGLAGDRLDHRAEDVADADAGAERAEADAERERDRLAGLDDGVSLTATSRLSTSHCASVLA